MNERLLHTPEGVRDIYNAECEKKLILERILHHRLRLYGFRDIQTPAFEFFDVFSKERGTVSSREMFKFFDREGNTLVLRPDMTPPIARCVAKYYRDENMPVRFSYCGNTFINNSSYQGKLKESTQLGAELILDDSVEADAEMIALTVECLLDAGLEKFQVEIGQADFFRGLMEEAGFSEEEAEELRILTQNKNMFGVEGLISDRTMPEALKNVILSLPELFGTLDRLLCVKDEVKNPRALAAVARLEKLYALLQEYGFEKYITFDLGMLSEYHYYTGIIFRAYTFGTGDAIVTGGRYDSLMSQFGKDAPAIGMAVLVDQLFAALSRQKLLPEPEAENTLIAYRGEFRHLAVSLAKQYRAQEVKVELYLEPAAAKLQEADYAAYAKRMNFGGVLYLKESGFAEIIHAGDGSVRRVCLEELMR